MNSRFQIALKIAITITTPALAVMASLYVLDVISSEALQETFRKVMAIVGIFTGAGLVTLFVASMGNNAAAGDSSQPQPGKPD